ncbi:MAG: hypothetical protein DHS20C18_19530 [Saprospiraceae bacterium]|nr:MAG: hypothetical protein DHS20C18_19530 [Saprospiraceae bacterium]
MSLKNPENAIRNQYANQGVEGYYREHGSDYTNPHFDQVRQLLIQNRQRIDYQSILDFSCGSGEVSQVIQELGYALPTASDPFTSAAYHEKFKQRCLDYSFQDVIKGQLEGQFSAIICSFAMHLCPPKDLFPLVFQLFQHTSRLVIITPHKRPELSKLSRVDLDFEDFCLTARGKKVRLRTYAATF